MRNNQVSQEVQNERSSKRRLGVRHRALSVIRLPEFYLFGIYPAVAMVIMTVSPEFPLRKVLKGMGGVRGPLFFFLAGPVQLKLLLLGLIFYVPWRALREGWRTSSGFWRAATGYFVTTVALYGALVVSNLVNSVMLTYLAHQDPQRVKEASHYLMELDHRLWGCYPVFVVQRLLPDWMGRLSIDAYLLFSSLAIIVFFSTMLSRVSAFRRFNCAMMFWTIAAVPMWILVPAVSPDEMYRQTIFGEAAVNGDIAGLVNNLHIIPELGGLLQRLSMVWSNPSAGLYAISCFPSFHVGGYLLLAYGLYVVHRGTLLIMLPLCVFNTIGALYTLQHYLVDFIPAVILSGIAIVFAERTCPEESTDPLVHTIYYPIVLLQEDVKQVLRSLRVGLPRP